jgi:hypothetical protein
MSRHYTHVPRPRILARAVLLLMLSLLSVASSSAVLSRPSPDTRTTLPSPDSSWSTGSLALSNPPSSSDQGSSKLPEGVQPPDVQPSRATALLIYGDYVNEAGQEPTAIWETVFDELGFATSTCHIASLPQGVNADLLVVLPSVGTHGTSFAVTLGQAQAVLSARLPTLLLGYAHEVLDRVWSFNPVADLIPCVERYLWTSDPSLQIFTAPYSIPRDGGQLDIYDGHVTSDAYRLSVLPPQASVLGTNFEGSGAQLLWFRAFSNNTAVYYWSVDQAAHLSEDGLRFLENLVYWVLRQPLAERLGSTLAAWQLALPSDGGYWAVQGAGGFGYPLEPSIAFTYYTTALIQTYSLQVNISSFGDWLLNACYNAVEGCFEDLASPQLNDRCVTTSMATLALAALNRLAELDATRVGDYLASCQDPATGGFCSQKGSSQTSLKATRFAIHALMTLSQLFKIDIAAAKAYIASCQELNPQSPEHGGFYASPGSTPASLATGLDAVQTLSLLESLDSINQTALLSFIACCEDPPASSIFDTKAAFGTDEWVMGTGCALRLLELLGALGVFDTEASRNFLLANQFPNGGWGRGDLSHDFHDSPDEAWYAVQGLAATGDLGSSRSGLANYLTDCCTGWGGATEPRCFGDLLTSWRVVSALCEVGGLSAINQSALVSYLANCWVIARSSVGWHQVPPNASMDTDIATPDRCIFESCTFGPLYHYAYSQLAEMLGLSGSLWSTRSEQIRTEIRTSQTFASAYRGMFGLHHLYVNHENDRTFRFDTTCWSLLAYGALGGNPSELLNATAALEYLRGCLQDNGTHQYFRDMQHQVELSVELRVAGGHLADTWLGLQAWAYLNPSMNGLDGHRLAAYATAYLEGTPSLVTAFYAADILHLLVKLDLDSDATDLIDREAVKALITGSTGLIQDSTLQNGRWTPYVTALALQLAADLNLLPNLDVNPALHVSLLTYPTGNHSCGETTTIAATVDETRWGVLPSNISLSATIFNVTFTDFIGPNPLQCWNCTVIIPYCANALGPQGLKVTAAARGCLPDWKEIAQVCQVWGNLSTTPAFAPGLVVPRSVPLNVTLTVKLQGGSGPNADIPNALVLLTNSNTSSSYSGVYRGGGMYAIQMPTSALDPGRYQLRLESTAPYAAKDTVTEFLRIRVYDTSFGWLSTTPTYPIAREPLSLHVCLQDENATRVVGGNVTFRLTKPGQAQPWLVLSSSTNASGIAACRWTPPTAGQWNITYHFQGLNQYNACSGETGIPVTRRPSRCTAEWVSASPTFVGNHCLLLATVVDSLNGSGLAGRTVSFYEGAALLSATLTNASGHATYSWTVAPPLGTRQFRVEVSETPLHDGWISAELSLTVRTTTAITFTSGTPQLYLGETGRIEVSIATQTPRGPNGTASIYWDGIWQRDFTILNGAGNAQFTVSYSDVPGKHLLAILFGHLDAPDVYAPSSASVIVEVLPVFVPTLVLTVSPAEMMDFRPAATISVDALLTYHNGTAIYGLGGNVTLQLVTADGTVLLRAVSQTNAAGEAHWILSMPQPGLYQFKVQFDGVRGFAPATAVTALTIRLPLELIVGQSLPLTLASLALIAVGLLVGAILFLRLQKRADHVVRLLLGTRHAQSTSPELPTDIFGHEPQPDETPAVATENSPDDERGDVT